MQPLWCYYEEIEKGFLNFLRRAPFYHANKTRAHLDDTNKTQAPSY